MSPERIISFPKKRANGKRKENREKISRELLQELTKDPAYRQFKENEDLSKQLGEAIVQLRKRKRLSPSEFAKRINKTESILARIERGEYKQYTMKLLQQIARECGTRLRIHFEE